MLATNCSPIRPNSLRPSSVLQLMGVAVTSSRGCTTSIGACTDFSLMSFSAAFLAPSTSFGAC